MLLFLMFLAAIAWFITPIWLVNEWAGDGFTHKYVNRIAILLLAGIWLVMTYYIFVV